MKLSVLPHGGSAFDFNGPLAENDDTIVKKQGVEDATDVDLHRAGLRQHWL